MIKRARMRKSDPFLKASTEKFLVGADAVVERPVKHAEQQAAVQRGFGSIEFLDRVVGDAEWSVGTHHSSTHDGLIFRSWGEHKHKVAVDWDRNSSAFIIAKALHNLAKQLEALDD